MFWYSTKSVYTKIRMVPELKSFGKSQLWLDAIFKLDAKKCLSVPRKPRLFGMFLVRNTKPAFASNATSTLPYSSILDVFFCSIFHESFEYRAKRTLLFFLYCPGVFWWYIKTPLVSFCFWTLLLPTSSYSPLFFLHHRRLRIIFLCRQRWKRDRNILCQICLCPMGKYFRKVQRASHLLRIYFEGVDSWMTLVFCQRR